MMRPALACLTATLLVAAAPCAFAQTAADPMAQTAPDTGAAPQADMPAPPPPPPAMPDASMQAPNAAGQPAAPATAGPPPVPGAPVAAPGAAPLPPVQPTVESNYAVQLLDNVCTPLLHKGDIKQITKANGFKQVRGVWTMKLAAGKTIVLNPPSPRNPVVCSLDIAYDADQWLPIVDALNTWAFKHRPQLQLQYQGYRTVAGTTTWAWNVFDQSNNSKIGLAYNVTKKPDGTPMGGKYDIGSVLLTDTTPG